MLVQNKRPKFVMVFCCLSYWTCHNEWYNNIWVLKKNMTLEKLHRFCRESTWTWSYHKINYFSRPLRRRRFHQHFMYKFFLRTSFFYVHVTRKSCQNVMFVQKICTFNIDEIDYRCQFYQHYKNSFLCVEVFCADCI